LIKKVYNKVTVSGNVLELLKTDEGILYGLNTSRKNWDTKRCEDMPRFDRMMKDISNFDRSIKRTKQTLIRSINSNYGRWSKNKYDNKFMTLTFKGEVTDYEFANKEFTRFIERLNYKVYRKKCAKLKYTAVIEHHNTEENQGIHFHVIFYNLPYILHSELLEIWRGKRGTGGVNIKSLDGVDNVGVYVTKYVEKEIGELSTIVKKVDDKFNFIDTFTEDKKNELMEELEKDFSNVVKNKHKKIYQQSRGLYKPIENSLNDYESTKLIDYLREHSDAIEVCDNYYEDERMGNVNYIQFKLKPSSFLHMDKLLVDIVNVEDTC